MVNMRKDAGFKTQAAFAKVANVSRCQVTQWENGRRYPRPEIIPRLASILGCTEGDIIAAVTAARHEKARGHPA